MSTDGNFMTRNAYFSVLIVFSESLKCPNPEPTQFPPSGDRRTAVGEHVRTRRPPPVPGARAGCWARDCCPRAARPARRSARAARTAPRREVLPGGARAGGEGPRGRPAASHEGNTSGLCAGHGHRRAAHPAAASGGWCGRMETAQPGTAPPGPAPLSPDAEVAAGPKRSWRRAIRPGCPRRPAARPLRLHSPSSRPGHRHRPRGSAQASPRSRRDGRVGVGCGRCCGRPRQSGAGGSRPPPPPLMPSRQQRTRWAAGGGAGPLTVPRQCRRGGQWETMARKGEASAHLYGERGASAGAGAGEAGACTALRPVCSADPPGGQRRPEGHTEFVSLGECGGAVVAGSPMSEVDPGTPQHLARPRASEAIGSGKEAAGAGMGAGRPRASAAVPAAGAGALWPLCPRCGAERGRAAGAQAEPSRLWDAWSVVRGQACPGVRGRSPLSRGTCGLLLLAARAAGASRWPCLPAPREGHRGQNFIWAFGLCFHCSLKGDVFATGHTGFVKPLSLFEGVAVKPISSSRVRFPWQNKRAEWANPLRAGLLLQDEQWAELCKRVNVAWCSSLCHGTTGMLYDMFTPWKNLFFSSLPWSEPWSD